MKSGIHVFFVLGFFFSLALSSTAHALAVNTCGSSLSAGTCDDYALVMANSSFAQDSLTGTYNRVIMTANQDQACVTQTAVNMATTTAGGTGGRCGECWNPAGAGGSGAWITDVYFNTGASYNAIAQAATLSFHGWDTTNKTSGGHHYATLIANNAYEVDINNTSYGSWSTLCGTTGSPGCTLHSLGSHWGGFTVLNGGSTGVPCKTDNNQYAWKICLQNRDCHGGIGCGTKQP